MFQLNGITSSIKQIFALSFYFLYLTLKSFQDFVTKFESDKIQQCKRLMHSQMFLIVFKNLIKVE